MRLPIMVISVLGGVSAPQLRTRRSLIRVIRFAYGPTQTTTLTATSPRYPSAR